MRSSQQGFSKNEQPIAGTNFQTRQARDWRADMICGIGSTAALAGAYSAYVVVLTALRRDSHWPQYHTTTWNLIGAYWIAALVAGSALGVLRPWLNRRWGAGVAGFFTGVVVYSAAGLAMQLPVNWIAFSIVAIVGGLAGLGLGLVFYDDAHDGAMSVTRDRRRVAAIIAIGIVLGLVVWALCYPPMCWLGGRYCQ
jgi:hypothetical protein